MTSPLIPEVWDLVQRAGEQNCFVYDSLGPVDAPGVGEPLDRMTNLVPGSDITAEQPTTSAQPTQGADGGVVGVDDWFDLSSFPADPSVITLFAVWTTNSSTDNNGVISARSTGSAIVELFDNSGASQVRAQFIDSDGVGPDVVLSPIDSSSGYTAAVARLNKSAGEVSLHLVNQANGQQNASGTATFTGDFDTSGNPRRIMNLASVDNWPLQGTLKNAGIATADLGEDGAKALRDALATHHGII
jgi:hypothetical protein